MQSSATRTCSEYFGIVEKKIAIGSVCCCPLDLHSLAGCVSNSKVCIFMSDLVVLPLVWNPFFLGDKQLTLILSESKLRSAVLIYIWVVY